MRLLLLFLGLLLSSCGASHYLKKAERALKKAEQLGADIKSDTVFVDKEVIVPKIEFDTVLKQVDFRDTITIEKERVVTRIKVNTVAKEIFVQTECPPDTLIIRTPVTVTREISAGYTLWQVIIGILVGLAAGYGARAFHKR